MTYATFIATGETKIHEYIHLKIKFDKTWCPHVEGNLLKNGVKNQSSHSPSVFDRSPPGTITFTFYHEAVLTTSYKVIYTDSLDVGPRVSKQ